MFKADGTRRDFAVNGDRFVIGRTKTCDLRIPLQSVSRQHCELIYHKGVWELRDLESSNGTFHNHKRVRQAVLAPGDEVGIGPVVFSMVIDGQPANITPVSVVLTDPPVPSPHIPAAGASAHSTDGDRARPQVLPLNDGNAMPAPDQEPYTPTIDLGELTHDTRKKPSDVNSP